MQKKREEPESDGSGSEEAESLHENEEEAMESNDDEGASENTDGDGAGPSGLGDGEKAITKKKRGIVYISSIPKYMNVTILREKLSEYAKIGRIFLQPSKLSSKFKHTIP